MLKIDPLDNYFFRSPIPFEAVSDYSLVTSIFPPLPTTYAGALKKYTLKDKRISIGFNGITIDDEIAFPMPLDLTFTGNEDEYKNAIFAQKSLGNSPMSNIPLSFCTQLPENSNKSKGNNDYYIKLSEMNRYLQGEKESFKCTLLSNYLIKETKLGIEIDNKKRTAKDGQLYEIQTIMPLSNVSLCVEAQNINVENNALLKLGGEGRKAKAIKINKQVEFENEIKYTKIEDKKTSFKLYLATPAIFAGGWLPSWVDEETKIGIFKFEGKQVKVKLLAATIGSKVLIGGYGCGTPKDEDKYCLNNDNIQQIIGIRKTNKPHEEFKKFKPKKMYYGVPAGSVYYFELLDNGNMEHVVSLFNKKCISEYRDSIGIVKHPIRNRFVYCDRGFGYTLVANLTEKQRGGI